MHIDGKPLLSRATVSSGRTLITFALGIILAKAYAIEPETITILGIDKLKIADLSAPAMWVIGFMLIGYWINLWGDYTSFRTWNSGEKWQNATRFGGRDEPLNNQIESLSNAIKDLKYSKKELIRIAEDQPKLSEYVKKFTELQERVKDLKEGVESLSWKAKVILYGWHFAVPLSLAVFALLILLFDIG